MSSTSGSSLPVLVVSPTFISKYTLSHQQRSPGWCWASWPCTRVIACKEWCARPDHRQTYRLLCRVSWSWNAGKLTVTFFTFLIDPFHQPRSLELHGLLGTLPDIQARGVPMSDVRLYDPKDGTKVLKDYPFVERAEPTPAFSMVRIIS